MAVKAKTTKKKAAKAPSKNKPKTAKKKVQEVDEEAEEGHPDEFVWMELSDEDFADFLKPEEDLLATESGFSLGDRLGSISKLEKIEENAVPVIVRRAGLKLSLKGSQISLTPEGAFLSIEELKVLAQWLLDEANKASEDYDIDFGA